MRRPGSVARALMPALTLALAGVLLAGCGSKPLSESQLAIQATRVCQLAGQQVDRIPSPSTPADSARYLKRGIALMKPELDQLRKLRPSGDIADVYAASIDLFAKKLGYMRETVHALAGGEDPVIAMRTLQANLLPIEQQEDRAWQTLQITACVNR